MQSGKNKIAAALLAIFLGGWGVHEFYLGKNKTKAVTFLLINTVGWLILWIVAFIPNIVVSIWSFVDGIMLLLMEDSEFDKQYNNTVTVASSTSPVSKTDE